MQVSIASVLLCLIAAIAPGAAAQTPSPTLAGASGADNAVKLPKNEPPMTSPAEVEEGESMAVIPAGQEELLSEMLGRGAALPGGCALSAGDVNGASVVATYTCPAGPVALALLHPDQAPRGAAKTERFGMVIKSGTAPDGLTDALIARIRAQEGKFEWKWVGAPRVQRASRPYLWWVAGAGVVLLAGVLAALRSRRR
jgi:hypothetical protein